MALNEKQGGDNALVSLQPYMNGKYNCLVPTTHMAQISPFHKMRVEEVMINPDPDGGEVFKVGSKKVGNTWEDVLSPGKPALLKLSNAAGIIWDFNRTRVVTATRDYVLYEAVGAIRKPSGEYIPLKATKEIDLVVIEEEVMESNLKKAKDMKPEQLKGLSPEQWATEQTRSNMIQWRKNKLMRAETGAMLRVIRALLNLKMQYSKSELSKPFIVPRVDFSPDYTDPEVRHMIMEHGVKATTELFSVAAGANQGLPPGQALGQAMGETQNAFTTPTMDVDGMDAGYGDTIEVEGEPVDGQNDISNTDLDDNPPWMEGETVVTCEGCAKIIESEGNWTAEQIVEYSQKNFGKKLCPACQKTAKVGGR